MVISDLICSSSIFCFYTLIFLVYYGQKLNKNRNGIILRNTKAIIEKRVAKSVSERENAGSLIKKVTVAKNPAGNPKEGS